MTTKFIEEVFITPIRSVLIIDDEYPTIDSLLETRDKRSNFWETCSPEVLRNADDLLSFTKFCRESDRGWLVDVHDGQNIEFSNEVPLASHLIERDLLILDYHIDGDSGTPSKAVQILKKLSGSSNFNIVIVYSKDNPDKIFREIVLDFVSPQFRPSLTVDESESVRRGIIEWYIEDAEIESKLKESITGSVYIELFLLKESKLRDSNVKLVCSNFLNLLKGKPDSLRDLSNQLIFNYFLSEFEARMPNEIASLTSISRPTATTKWIRSDNLFVTFVQKSSEGNSAELIPTAIEALCDWNPSPNRLFLSKFRAVLAAQAAQADDKAMRNLEMQALWLHEMLSADPLERRGRIQDAVARYGERLLDAAIPDVTSFACDVIKLFDDDEDKGAVVKRFFSIDIKDGPSLQEARIGHNIYCCSKEPVGSHLTIGHILEMGSDLWVCLTPACDLVPMRKSKFPGDAIRFKAVKLYVCPTAEAALSDKGGSTLFLDISGRRRFLSFNRDCVEGASPDWAEFLALNQGAISQASLSIDICRFSWVKTSENEAEDFGPMHHLDKAKIVSQLRYEYAINLLHRLGHNLARVGLDFR